MTTAAHVHRFALEDFDRMIDAGVFGPEDRVQLVEGVLYDMAPQSSRHATTVQMLCEALRQALPDEGFHIRGQFPLRLGRASQPEPDIAVVRGSLADYVDQHPRTAELVAEVSDSSLRHDRMTKAQMYGSHGIAVYWVLSLADPMLEQYRDPDELGRYRQITIHAPDDSVTLPDVLGTAELRVADLLPRPPR